MAGLYIHIPLCASRCAYCDFYSSTDHSLTQPLVDALCSEMEMRKDYIKEPVQTIYLGGGTPSVLPIPLLKQLFDTASRCFNLQTGEVTIECNPDDVTPGFAEALAQQLPVNRVSMGVQSFNDDDLRLINRRHTAQQAFEAVDNLRMVGIGNISIDLIYGLPYQTEDGWQRNLDVAASLNVPHLSAYSLTYEEGTALYRMMEKGRVKPATEELSLRFFQMLCDSLKKAGYEHYEISNFAKPGMAAQHNSSYWNGTPYWGIGPSAHSFNGRSRQWNVANTKQYIEALGCGKLDAEIEVLSPEEAFNDRILTSLRTSRGLDLVSLKNDFPQFYDQCLAAAQTSLDAGHLEFSNNGRVLKLTAEGIFVSDAVFVDLMQV